MRCPNCKSTKLQKKGLRDRKQRYRCSSCGASFTKGIPYKPAQKLPKVEKECPKCGSNHIIRDGKLEDGSQRYECISCGTNFSSKTILPGIKWSCPYCNGKLIYSGYSRKGCHEYMCKKCGRSCTADAKGKPIKREYPFPLINTEIKCPRCSSTRIKKAGFSTSRTQRLICMDCNKPFSVTTKVRPPKEELIKLILEGHNLNKLSESSGYSVRYLRRIAQHSYAQEVISDEQAQIIIKYGYHLKVPVDFMAEYIKCSEHKCREVLANYKKELMSTSSDAIS